MNFFKNKTILITGGTGSFGSAFIFKILKSKINFKEIRVFSRDEKKQDNLRKKINNYKIKFLLGDVRDVDSVKKAIKNVDFIFHAAALKQVPSCEFYPLEAVKTNILGTDNVIQLAIENLVKKVVVLSTDKAVYPINAMGMSKALMEKIAISNKEIGKLRSDITKKKIYDAIENWNSQEKITAKELANKIQMGIATVKRNWIDFNDLIKNHNEQTKNSRISKS
jgi:FlaA1/EpsC-like NDP-sugar epimerase